MKSQQDNNKNHTGSYSSVFMFLSFMIISVGHFTFLPYAFAQSDIEIYFDRQFNTSGAKSGLLWRPFGVAVDSRDRIIIVSSDHENDEVDKTVHVCDDRGNCTSFGGRGSELGKFNGAKSLTVDSSDRIIVSDFSNNRIQICDDLGECTAFGSFSGMDHTEADPGKFREPWGVAVDSQGQIIVSDSLNHRIQVCSETGICTVFGSEGKSAGEFAGPKGVAVNKQDQIIVADTRNDRIQICSAQGACSIFGEKGTAPGQFESPTDVAVDSEGRIYVVDNSNHRIQVCSDTGECEAFGNQGADVGQFNSPLGLAVDGQDRVIVADNRNDRMQIFRTDGPFQINAGLNDAWYNPVTDGQGFFITVYPELGVVVLAWFTYDTELPPEDATANLGDAGHRWLLAVGSFEDNKAVLDIEIASGGIFDTDTEINRAGDGTITLTFDNCTAGTVEYDIPSINQKGTVPIKRVASDNIKLCQALDEEFTNNQ